MRSALFLVVTFPLTLGQAATVLDCPAVEARLALHREMPIVASAGGQRFLALASGKKIPLQRSGRTLLSGSYWYVGQLPLGDFRFDQEFKHMNITHILQSLENPREMRHLLEYGVYQAKDRGELDPEGLYRIANGHHRTIAMAVYSAFLKHGNKTALSDQDPAFYPALALWAKEAVFNPLHRDFVPNGSAQLRPEVRVKKLAEIQNKILSILAESPVPIFLRSPSPNQVTLDSRLLNQSTPLRSLLLPAAVANGAPTVNPLGAGYAKDFDNWMAKYSESYPEFSR